MQATAGQSGDSDIVAWIQQAGMGEVTSSQVLGSSDWSSFHRLRTSAGADVFVKTSSRSAERMFRPEALGLSALRGATKDAGLMRIPEVYHVGDRASGRGSFIAMEYLNLAPRGDAVALGRAMASMHTHRGSGWPQSFGFEVDNSIGETPQRNTWCQEWVEFYREHRLRPQIDLAGDGYASSLFASIAPRLERLFEGIVVAPSVLHGDLWSGNIGSADGKPSIFDPAVYYGHHEAEWGMSWAASLSSDFWKGYREIIPEDPGFSERRPLYEAYHQLNHYNLFGGDYLGAGIRCLEAVKRSLDAR